MRFIQDSKNTSTVGFARYCPICYLRMTKAKNEAPRKLKLQRSTSFEKRFAYVNAESRIEGIAPESSFACPLQAKPIGSLLELSCFWHRNLPGRHCGVSVQKSERKSEPRFLRDISSLLFWLTGMSGFQRWYWSCSGIGRCPRQR